MKQSKLNPLQQELANLPVAGPHPDFDVLTAFAEGRLLEREREEVLAHLAACAACRELLSTAAAAQQEVNELKPYLMPRPSRPPLNTWLPWVSIAATILIAASAVIYFRNKDQFSQTIAVEVQPQPRSSTTMQSPQPGPAFSTSEPPAAASQDASPAARPHWRIDAAGQPERSYNGGPWQAVLSNEKSKMRVISIFDSDLWIGGENTRLYRSTDNGLTWKQVSLPAKNGSQHTIAHIHFQTPQTGKVESTDGTTWTTTDAGVTWQ